MNRWMTAVLAAALMSGTAAAQSERSLVNRGNDLYDEEKYDAAEIQYRKALSENEASVPGRFNLGNALHKQGKFDQSVNEFDAAASEAADVTTREDALFNRGNSLVEGKKYDAAIASYIEALKIDPHDAEAKYNLSYALMKRQEQQQDQKGKGKQDQKQQDQQKDQQQKDQQQKDQDKNRKDQQDQQQNQKNRQDQQDQQRPEQQQDHQMSRADAERILEVLKNNEKQVQKELRTAKTRQRAKSDKDW